MIKHRKRRKPTSDINIVPYIDVMLVLLIIFMVTAPLMNLGVDINLPRSGAKPQTQTKLPLIVSVDKDGKFFVTQPADPTKPSVKPAREMIATDKLGPTVGAFVALNKELQVMIEADERVPYGKVYEVMAILQLADVQKVSFISQPIEKK